jgi:hypothetical protein
MQRDQNSAFAASCLDNSFKLAVARDLQRQFSSVLTEPLPSDLKRFIALLETRPRASDPFGTTCISTESDAGADRRSE